MAELHNIPEFTLKALAAVAGLSPSEYSSGSSMCKSGRNSRVGSERLRSARYMCGLSAKRTNKAFTDFVGRLTAAGKPPKIILIAIARKRLVFPAPSFEPRNRSILPRTPPKPLDPLHCISWRIAFGDGRRRRGCP